MTPDWQKISALAATGSALFTLVSPLIALQISAWLSDRRDKYRRKFEVFQTLMQWRTAPFAERPVQAMNVIDVLFHDAKPVRDAWANLFASYNDSGLNSPEGSRLRKDRLNELLHEMAHNLGYKAQFSTADFERVYNPEILGRFYAVQMAQTNAAFDALTEKSGGGLLEAANSSEVFSNNNKIESLLGKFFKK